MSENQEQPYNNEEVEDKVARRRFRRWHRILSMVGLVCLILGIIAFIWVRFYFNPYLKDFLEKTIAKETGNLYELEIKHLNVSILPAKINIHQVRLKRNFTRWAELKQTRPYLMPPEIQAEIFDLRLEGVHWLKYLIYNELQIEKLILNQPDLQLKSYPSINDLKPAPKKNWQKTLSEFIHNFSNHLIINKLEIKQGNLNLKFLRPVGELVYQTDSLDVELQGFKIKTSEAQINWGSFAVKAHNYYFHLPDGAYQLTGQYLEASSRDSILNLKSLRIKPFSLLQFQSPLNLKKYQATRIDLRTKSIQANRVDFRRIIEKQEFEIGKLNISQSQFVLQTDRRLFDKWNDLNSGKDLKINNLPKNDLKNTLRNIPLYLHLDTLQISETGFYISAIQHQNLPQTYHQGDSLQLNFYNLSLGKAIDARIARKTLFSQAVEFKLQNYEHLTPDGFFQINIQKIRLSSLDSMINMEQARLKPLISPQQYALSKTYQSILLSADIQRIRANKLDIERLAYKQEFVMGGIHLYQPDFEAFLDKRKPIRPGQKYQNFEQLLQSIPLYIAVDTFNIHKAKIKYIEKDSISGGLGEAIHQAQNINVSAYRIQLGKALNGSVLAEIDTKNLVLNLKKYHYQTPNGLYRFDLRSLDVSSAQSIIHLDSVSLKPQITEPEFFKNQNYRSPYIQINVNAIKGQKIDFKKLLLKQEVDWQWLSFQSPQVFVTNDKRLPRKPKKEDLAEYVSHLNPDDSLNINRLDSVEILSKSNIKRDLRQLLANLPVFLKIDTLEIKQANIFYKEHNFTEQGKGLATHFAENISCTIPRIHLGKAERMNEDSTRRVFYSNDIYFTLQKYRFQDKNDLYRFELKNIKGYLADSILNVDSLIFEPLLTKEDFFKHQAYRSMYTRVKLQSIATNTIDIERLLFDQELYVKALNLNEPQIELTLDQSQDPSPVSQKISPQVFLKGFPFYAQIDTFKINQANFSFLEWQNPQTTQKPRFQAEKISLGMYELKVGLDQLKTETLPLALKGNLFYYRDLIFQLSNYQSFTADKLYEIKFKNLSYLPEISKVKIDSFWYQPVISQEKWDQTNTKNRLRMAIQMPLIEFKAPDWQVLFENKQFNLPSLTIFYPKIQLYQNLTLPKVQKDSISAFKKLFSSIKTSIRLDTLQIVEADCEALFKLPDSLEVFEQRHQAEKINMQIFGFQIDSLQTNFSKKLHWFDDFALSLQNYRTNFKNRWYNFEIGALNANSYQSSLLVNNLKIRPLADIDLTLEEKRNLYSWQMGRQADWYDSTTVQKLVARGVDYEKMLDNQQITIKYLEGDKLTSSIFRDKRYPRDTSVALMLNEKFQKIKLPLKIDTLQLKNSAIFAIQRTEGYNTKEDSSRQMMQKEFSEVFFDDINLRAYHLNTNGLARDTSLIHCEAKFLGKGKLVLNMKIPLLSPHLFCKYYGSLGKMDATILNEVIEANRPIRIKSGSLERISFNVTLNDSVAVGTLIADYRKLRIQFLKAEDHRKKRGFITFWANLILKNRNNTERNRFREGKVNYERNSNHQEGFFAILWRALATGLLDTLR
jgi:hypothetical protein